MTADIVRIERGIQAALSPLMGTISVGSLRVHSTGATGTLPARSIAVPIEDGDFRDEGAVFASKNPATKDGSWPITSDGVDVAVESLQGGIIGNHTLGDRFRWFPSVDGVEETSVASTTIAGGVASQALGAIVQLRNVREFTSEAWKDFYTGRLGVFPGVAIAWQALAPLDGHFGAPGPRSARMGTYKIKFKHTFSLFLVTSRADSAVHRRTEAAVLLQNIVETLFGKTGARGWRLSNNPGVQITSAGLQASYPSSYIDLVNFDCVVVLSEKDRATANPWLTTRLRVDRKNEPGDSGAPLVGAGPVIIPMPPGETEEDEDTP